ncbi:MAG: exodeoxyribonuclease VII small subunit [Eggerthellaceae bacterium]|nr:exodeoxyribonuclease VII small subunit [Eggerthellaceae bacterium]
MKAKASEYETFEAVKARLDDIVSAVDDDALSLDGALDLYEEAVSLGMRASDLLEEGISSDELMEDASKENGAASAQGDSDSKEIAAETISAASDAE